MQQEIVGQTWGLAPKRDLFEALFTSFSSLLKEGDSIFFQIAGRRVVDEVDRIPVGLLADIIAIHNEIGIRNDRVFRAPSLGLQPSKTPLLGSKMGYVL